MNKKTKRQQLKKLVEKSIIRDEEKQRIKWNAKASTEEVLMSLNSSLAGLNETQISRSRMIYGKNQLIENQETNIIQLILNSLNRPTCNVVRKYVNLINIPSDELVVGDIVHLTKGDIVPADLRVIQADHLILDESVIEKDRTFVEKGAERCKDEQDKVTDYYNIALMGTSVIEGSAQAVAFSVGSHTILGTMS